MRMMILTNTQRAVVNIVNESIAPVSANAQCSSQHVHTSCFLLVAEEREKKESAVRKAKAEVSHRAAQQR